MVCDTVNKGLGGHTFSISSYFVSSTGMGLGGGGGEGKKGGEKETNKQKPKLIWFIARKTTRQYQVENNRGKRRLQTLTEAESWRIGVKDFTGIHY